MRFTIRPRDPGGRTSPPWRLRQPLDRTMPDVPGGEDSRNVCFEVIRRSIENPSVRRPAIVLQVVPGHEMARTVSGDARFEGPISVRRATDANKQPAALLWTSSQLRSLSSRNSVWSCRETSRPARRTNRSARFGEAPALGARAASPREAGTPAARSWRLPANAVARRPIRQPSIGSGSSHYRRRETTSISASDMVKVRRGAGGPRKSDRPDP
jgi:hypothetical protein